MITGVWVLVVFLTGGLVTSVILVLQAWDERDELVDRVRELEVTNLGLEQERIRAERHEMLTQYAVDHFIELYPPHGITFSEEEVLRELGGSP